MCGVQLDITRDIKYTHLPFSVDMHSLVQTSLSKDILESRLKYASKVRSRHSFRRNIDRKHIRVKGA